MNKRKIAHAVAYIDVFMMNSNPDESELQNIFKYADSLSSQEVISIIKDSVKRNNISGREIVLTEMESAEFRKYIEERMNYYRSVSLEA